MKKYSVKLISVILSAVFVSSILFCTDISAASDLPSEYITEAVTPVLDQKNNPLCWAYSCADMLSINAVKKGYSENGNTVFSAPMIARAEFDGNEHRHSGGNAWFNCFGGIDYALMAAISGKGLLFNTDYPTVDSADKADVSALYSGCSYVNEFLMIDTNDMSVTERTEVIKQLIYEYGAVSADAFIGDYDKISGTADIGPYDNSKASHAVLLVGWDDGKETDGGTGAFLMKNTWGVKWGDGGFAWISYDSELGMSIFAADIVIDDDMRVFTHTETIFASGTSSEAEYGEFGAVNVFDIDGKMTLKQIGVYTGRKASEISVKVYKNLTDVTNIIDTFPDASAEKAVYNEGYYTLDLNKDIELNENDTVTVLYIIKADSSYYVFSEFSDPDFEMSVTKYEPGQSYTYVRGELKEPKGNYIGTIICKTDHVDEPETETETYTITDDTAYAGSDTEEETSLISTGTELIITVSNTDVVENISDTDYETEYDSDSLPDDMSDVTELIAYNEMTRQADFTEAEYETEEDIGNKAANALKKIFITVFIIAAVLILLFILLIISLIAASKKKKI